jgi:hypothetical protein
LKLPTWSPWLPPPGFCQGGGRFLARRLDSTGQKLDRKRGRESGYAGRVWGFAATGNHARRLVLDQVIRSQS